MPIPLLTDIEIILGLSIGILFLFLRMKMPAVIGFFLTGILAGPHGLGLVKAVHEVEVMAEIGVVLLLFTIGIEFSFNQLLEIKKSVLLGGSLQVLLTGGAAFLAARHFGFSAASSVFLGFLLSLSSTAIVLKVLQEKASVDSPHGRTALAILIFQDILVVPMMLFIPLLGGNPGNWVWDSVVILLKGAGVILFVLLAAKWAVPTLLFFIVGTQSRELFMFGVLGICLGVAWLTSSVGLSLSLGAFLAGLIISESEYNHQALGNVLPFKDIFSGFFFVSVGMLLDVRFLFDHLTMVLLLTAAVMLLKTLPASLATASLGFPLRTVLMVGLSLSQIGEFSFVLAKMGSSYGLLNGENYQFFLAVSILTMGLTPFVISSSPRISEIGSRVPGLSFFRGKALPVGNDVLEPIQDHVIIVGFGVCGRNVARAARIGQIPYRVVELNPETVRKEREKGEPILFGDAAQETVLETAGLHRARILILVINDAVATRRITDLARRLNPRLYIIVRTRFLNEVEPLYRLGADEVIPEEFETAVEIFTRLLKKYLVPQEDINRLTAEVRSQGYKMFRSSTLSGLSLEDLKRHVTDMDIQTFRIGMYSSAAAHTLAELNLRKEYGVSVLAVRRGTEMRINPDGDFRGKADDLWFLMGSPDQLERVAPLFANPKKEEARS